MCSALRQRYVHDPLAMVKYAEDTILILFDQVPKWVVASSGRSTLLIIFETLVLLMFVLLLVIVINALKHSRSKGLDILKRE